MFGHFPALYIINLEEGGRPITVKKILFADSTTLIFFECLSHQSKIPNSTKLALIYSVLWTNVKQMVPMADPPSVFINKDISATQTCDLNLWLKSLK